MLIKTQTMTNQITGDWDQDALDEFRAAYAAQLYQPEQLDEDPISGMPTNVISNTSPWLEHTGLWKANDGISRVHNPREVLVPGSASVSQSEDSEEDDALTEEELEELIRSVLEDEEDEEELLEVEEPYSDEDSEEEELSEDELESLINELLLTDYESEEEQS